MMQMNQNEFKTSLVDNSEAISAPSSVLEDQDPNKARTPYDILLNVKASVAAQLKKRLG